MQIYGDHSSGRSLSVQKYIFFEIKGFYLSFGKYGIIAIQDRNAMTPFLSRGQLEIPIGAFRTASDRYDFSAV